MTQEQQKIIDLEKQWKTEILACCLCTHKDTEGKKDCFQTEGELQFAFCNYERIEDLK